MYIIKINNLYLVDCVYTGHTESKDLGIDPLTHKRVSKYITTANIKSYSAALDKPYLFVDEQMAENVAEQINGKVIEI